MFDDHAKDQMSHIPILGSEELKSVSEFCTKISGDLHEPRDGCGCEVSCSRDEEIQLQ